MKFLFRNALAVVLLTAPWVGAADGSARTRPLDVRIRVAAWEDDTAANARMSADGFAARGPRQALDLPSLEIIAVEAVTKAGWQSSDRTDAPSLLVELRLDPGRHFALRATWQANGVTQKFVRQDIHEDSISIYLIHFFRLLRNLDVFYDIAPLGSSAARLLVWAEGCAIVQDGLFTRSLDPSSGRLHWSREAGPKENPLFAVRYLENASPRLFRYDGALRPVDPTGGFGAALAPGGTLAPGLFDLGPDGAAAVVHKGALTVYRDGKAAWVSQDFVCRGHPVFVGPVLVVDIGDSALAGLDPSSGVVSWEVKLERSGEIALSAVGGKLFAEQGGTLHLLHPQTGQVLWQHELGDRLVSLPCETAAGVVVASKLNDLRLLDARDGTVKAERHWPTWLREIRAGVLHNREFVVCSDLRNRVVFLDAATLETQRSVDIAQRLTPGLWLAPQAPVPWQVERQAPATDSMEAALDQLGGDLRAAVLCVDDEGFVYALKVPQ